MTAETTVPTWTHRGVTITLNIKSGMFRAEVPGKRLVAPSLASMEKQIDKDHSIAFVPFDAYVEIYGWHAKEADKVVASLEDHYRGTTALILCRIINWRQEDKKFIDGDGSTHGGILPATPEAIQAWLAYHAAWAAKGKRVSELEDECSALHKKIPYITGPEK